MPTGTNYYACVFSGTLTGEIFAHKQHVASTSADPEYVADQMSSHVTNLLATAVTSGPVATMAAAFADWVSWTLLRVEPITTTGSLLPGGISATRSLTDVGTGNGSLGMPYQCTHSITTRSSGTGRRNKNRFYLPPYVVGVTNGKGIVAAPVCVAIGAWLANQQTALNSLSPEVELINISPADAAAKDIVDSYIGNVIDTQRRRRNALTEARTVTAV